MSVPRCSVTESTIYQRVSSKMLSRNCQTKRRWNTLARGHTRRCLEQHATHIPQETHDDARFSFSQRSSPTSPSALRSLPFATPPLPRRPPPSPPHVASRMTVKQMRSKGVVGRRFTDPWISWWSGSVYMGCRARDLGLPPGWPVPPQRPPPLLRLPRMPHPLLTNCITPHHRPPVVRLPVSMRRHLFLLLSGRWMGRVRHSLSTRGMDSRTSCITVRWPRD